MNVHDYPHRVEISLLQQQQAKEGTVTDMDN